MESIDVRVVSVEVVVVDRDGKRVFGLQKGDFEILEDGKQQTITNFYEVRPRDVSVAAGRIAYESDPVERRRRRFVLFFDSYSLDARTYKRVLESARTFVEREVRDEDEAALVLWNRRLEIIRPLGAEKSAILGDLTRLIEHHNAMTVRVATESTKNYCIDQYDAAASGVQTFPAAYQSCINFVNQYADEDRQMGERLLLALRATITMIAGVDGRKVLVLAGGHLSQRPGLELHRWAMQLFSTRVSGIDPDRALLMTRSQADSIDAIARHANASGVTLYVIGAPGMQNVITAENDVPPDPASDKAGVDNTMSSYHTLAAMTGGLSLTDTNLNTAFESVAHDLSAYYSLGYEPHGEEGRTRRLTVQAKNRDYVVRARHTQLSKTSEQQMTDRVVANAFRADSSAEWPITVRTGQAQRSGRHYKVPVEISIPSDLLFLPDGTHLVGRWSIYLVVGNEKGELSDVIRRPQTIRIDADVESRFRQKPIVVATTLVVRGGSNTISIGVIDTISGRTGFSRTVVLAK